MSLQTTMMDSTGQLYRPRTAFDSVKGLEQNIDLSNPLVANFRCSVQDSGLGTITLYAQRNVRVTTRLYCIQNIGAAVNDYITAVDDYTQAQRNFQVKGNMRPVAQLGPGPLWYVDVLEIY